MTTSIDRKIAASAARRLGFTDDQHVAYFDAIHAAPATGPNGEAVPQHDIGMEAARKAGYGGGDHPSEDGSR
jgi:hypothetical protein